MLPQQVILLDGIIINVKGKIMKIKSIKSVGKLPVYDISVADNQQYVLENGIIVFESVMFLFCNMLLLLLLSIIFE